MSTPDQKIDVYTKKNFKAYVLNHKERQHGLVARVLEEDFAKLVSNFKCDSICISLDSESLIATVTNKEYDSSPICSPFNLFCTYPKQHIQSIQTPWLKHSLNLCIFLFSLSFKRTQFNRVIQVNNKPCDAIVYPDLSANDVEHCVQKLTAKFPKHAVIFPRIDKITKPLLHQNLVSNGFLMIHTRPVHIFHPDNNYLKRSHTKRDMALLGKQNYTFVSHDAINEKDLIRFHELYQMLFIEKHNKENPNLTLRFFKHSHAHQWYTYFGFRNAEGVIDAFLSYETHERVMACGPLGYDTFKGKELALYRRIFAQSLKIAHQNQYIFNFGGANEQFKMNRGSRREIGYTAVYCDHLPFYQRFPWLLLANLGKKLTGKIFDRMTL